jgi:outer membrane protein OmpA-like peptidoglycan-associated protein
MRAAIASTCAAAAAAVLTSAAAPALAGPDFVAPDRRSSLAASDAHTVQEPSDEVLFALDSAALDSIALAALPGVPHWLEGRPDDRVVLEGHADSTGGAQYNAALAMQRAEAVRDQLVAVGVAPDRIVLAVYGENGSHPRPDGHDRSVIMYTSSRPLPQLISTELDRSALEVVWTQRGTRLRETRGITPVATIAPGR